MVHCLETSISCPDILPSQTNCEPDRPHQPTTQSPSCCRISPQNTPCTYESTSTSHQERTPCKVSSALTVMTLFIMFYCIFKCWTTSRMTDTVPTNTKQVTMWFTTQVHQTATYNISIINTPNKHFVPHIS